MNSTLSVLNGKGDTKLTWDADDPDRCREVRETVEALKLQGFTFFLVGGEPADEVAAGAGTLLIRRLDAAEVVPDEPAPVVKAESAPAGKRRGRPPGAARNVVAVPVLRGG